VNILKDEDLKSLCDRILSEGLRALNLSMGLVSKIENGVYEIIAVESTGDVFVAGVSYPLNDTYCREVVEKKKTIALTEINLEQGLSKHPLYDGLPLEVYISTPIYKNNTSWGTLNYSCMLNRKKPFTENEINFVEKRAEQISDAL
jgi:GAF domain-containing protein